MLFKNQLDCANLEFINGEFRDRDTCSVLSIIEAYKLIGQAIALHTNEYYNYLEGRNEL